MECPRCGKCLDPQGHGEMVCDGEVFCDVCHRYDRRLLEPRSFEDITEWHQRLCQACGCEAHPLRLGDPPPPAGPFDFLEDQKLLMAEAHHQSGVIVLYPAGLRLATLCHELAHLLTGQDHTEAWARTFAKLVAWVREQLPPDHFTAGMRVNLLKSKED
jgi:hypothetical protein